VQLKPGCFKGRVTKPPGLDNLAASWIYQLSCMFVHNWIFNALHWNWRITQFNTIYEYRLNRKAANEVRKKYADFLNYIKGMVNLRSEMVEPSRWARRQKPYAAVVVGESELPQSARGGTIHALRIEFAELLRADQPEDTRHLSYNKAFGLAVRWALGMSQRNSVNFEQVKLPADEVLGLIDELLLRAHAQDILVWTELKVGQVPSGKYKGWMPERT